jgi:uncharacterized protein (TIGR02217 family)
MGLAFDDVRLPEDIEAGALVGPQFQTSIVQMQNGKEQRNADSDQERLTANIAYGVMQKDSVDDIEDSFARIMRFYRARQGQWRSFRFKDLTDFEVVGADLRADDTGKLFQLISRYGEYRRRITRPVASTLFVYVGGVLVPAGPNTWALDPLGVVRFNAPPAGAVTADFEFDVPMRFDSDVVQVAIEYQNAGSVSDINLIQAPE